MRTANKGLTPREREISELVAWGSSHKEIADKLHRSPSTIGNTLRKLYEKLGINKESELAAVVFCSKYGVDPENDPIGNVKRAISSLALLSLLIFQTLIGHDTTMRPTRTVRARRARTEQTIES